MSDVNARRRAAIHAAISPSLRRRGMQARVAEAFGLRAQTVNKWTSGENVPPPERWSRLEEILELDAGTIAEAADSVTEPDPAPPGGSAAGMSEEDELVAAMGELTPEGRQALLAIAREMRRARHEAENG